MKRYLAVIAVIIAFLATLCTNITVWAEDNAENTYDEATDVGPETSLVTDDEIENCMIIGTGNYDQEVILFLDNYATYYFSELTNNFGNNYIGSCSYTAAAMLLSYYDTYWDDGIIPEHYEKNRLSFNNSLPISSQTNSPGILRETVPQNVDYSSFVESNKDQYFHLKLISIGLETGIDLLGDYVLFPNSVKDLLEYYFYDILEYDSSDVTVDHITGFEDVREYAINKVKQGIPVFVSATNPEGSAHSFIIYDYNEEDDELYCHMGWKNQLNSDGDYLTTHVSFSSIEYTLFEGAVSISFNTEHSHSDNYVDVSNNTYCSCYFSCHPEHEHIYESVNNTYHMYSCQCEPQGAQIEHDMYLSMSVGTNQHGYKCCDCGYIDEDTVEEHSFDYWVYQDLTRHRSLCECGARGDSVAFHWFRTSEDNPELMICSGCGFTKKVGNDSGNVILSAPKVTVNGSYQMPDGTVYLVDADIEAYFNGTLVFYDKDDLPVVQ